MGLLLQNFPVFQSLRTNTLENYDFPDINAQYVRIEVIETLEVIRLL